ncbi:MAG: chemotaxis-specific protein-glutamate methyltransferase CheB [Methanoregulaceae archaeon]|nr:chemotaxis-specific protein-glutamate methyltransferase CheB [Methanoregulaceae archaeon]
MIRVLIVDDSLFMRTVIRDMLGKSPGIEVVGTAVDGEDALKKIEDLSPDVMTLDIEMPRLDGLGLLGRRDTVRKFPRVIMLSSLTARGASVTRQAMDLGADDFMLKPKEIRDVRGIGQELLEKIRNVVEIGYIQKRPGPADELATRVVLIGSSAGGPPMLDHVLSSIGGDLPGAVIITQHMPEGGFTAALAARLNRVCPLPVKESESGDIIRSGHVYISKAGYHSIITSYIDAKHNRGGRIIHTRSAPVHSVRPAVDQTFISAAGVFGSNIVSVILSGMGGDGGEGTEAVKTHGGTTFVCREEDCLVYGMARSALTRNCVDKVLPLKSIGKNLTEAIAGMVH